MNKSFLFYASRCRKLLCPYGNGFVPGSISFPVGNLHFGPVQLPFRAVRLLFRAGISIFGRYWFPSSRAFVFLAGFWHFPLLLLFQLTFPKVETLEKLRFYSWYFESFKVLKTLKD